MEKDCDVVVEADSWHDAEYLDYDEVENVEWEPGSVLDDIEIMESDKIED